MIRRHVRAASITLAWAFVPGLVVAIEPHLADVKHAEVAAAKGAGPLQSTKTADYVIQLDSDDDEANPPDLSHNFGPRPGDMNDEAQDAGNNDTKGEEVEVIKERFKNGSIKIEREVTQDQHGNYVNDGSWKMWDERGQLVAQGQYQNGKRKGTWVRWYRSATEADLLGKSPYQQFIGPFISQATFVDGQLHGTWTIYDSKMHKISQWRFAEGKREGVSTSWHATGKKMREVTYHNGDLDGRVTEWKPDGAVRLQEEYQQGRKLAEKLIHHNGGSKKSSGMFLFAKEEEKTPDDWWQCKPHTLVKTGHDERHGKAIVWHPNAQMQLSGEYEHDVQIGLFTWWHASGQKALEGHFDHGKQDGEWTWWYASGQKSIHGEYAHGNPTGRWTWWKEDGKVAQSADLSGSEGVVIETPRATEPGVPPAPRMSSPGARQPLKR
ncbi:MAG TPA: hypothetical protein VGJ16_00915 [Pirellulales bacterium]|jgi:antitoxin component YwqK of YwqJK toxin-antitoxin module